MVDISVSGPAWFCRTEGRRLADVLLPIHLSNRNVDEGEDLSRSDREKWVDGFPLSEEVVMTADDCGFDLCPPLQGGSGSVGAGGGRLALRPHSELQLLRRHQPPAGRQRGSHRRGVRPAGGVLRDRTGDRGQERPVRQVDRLILDR